MVALKINYRTKEPGTIRNSPIDGLIIDNFAGGGGASLGLNRALGRDPDIAINHDLSAVRMHEANHPGTKHYCESVWDVDPVKACGGRKVSVAWFSPDCKHFSRAKGSKPVDKNIRGLAWVVVRWAKSVRPQIIFLENVREFQDWGPLIEALNSRGKPVKDEYGNIKMIPDPARKGQTFRRWVTTLRNLGYTVQWKELNAADYGAPTHRRRLFLVARCDGQAICWPEPTHGPGRMYPYRTAADCIDWTIPCHSIFLTKEEGKKVRVNRPLAENTLRRIANGLRKYVLEAKEPFIVGLRGPTGSLEPRSVSRPMDTIMPGKTKHLVTGIAVKGGEYRGTVPYIAGVGGRQAQTPPLSANHTLSTVTAKNDKVLVTPCIVKVNHGKGHTDRSHTVDSPLHTVTGKHGTGIAAASLVPAGIVQANHGGHNYRSQDLHQPLNTVTTERSHAVSAAYVTRIGQTGSNGGNVNPPDAPLTTVVSKNEHLLTCATLVQTGYGEREGQAPRSLDPNQPLGTVVAGGVKHAIAAAHLMRYNTEKGNDTQRSSSMEGPIGTVVTENRHAMVSAFLAKHYGGVTGHGLERPIGTVTAKDHHSLVAAHVTKFNQNGDGQPASEPLKTVVAGATRFGVVAPTLTKFYGTCKDGQRVTDPVPTVTADGQHVGVVAPYMTQFNGQSIGSSVDEPVQTVTSMNKIGEVRAFLVKFYGTCNDGQPINEPAHTLTAKARLGLVTIEGQDYQIVDIGMRMLKPRELFRAQGFPDTYILTGTDTEQVARCGNSVPPVMAEVLARANVHQLAAKVA